MRRLTLEGVPEPHFIGCWDLERPAVCDGLIDHFERTGGAQRPGFVGAGVVDSAFKQSLDLPLAPKALKAPENAALADYFGLLNECFWDYLEQWAFLKSVLDGVHIGSFNLQKYETGGHFGGLHSERTSLGHAHRVLVWMTYLNDVAAGGETEFAHFGIKVRPQTGKTLIWPAEWTHAHRGLKVDQGPKYIITGWMHFPA